MYRTAANVEKTYETLHTMHVSTARLRNVFGALAAFAVIPSTFYVVFLVKGRPGDLENGWLALVASGVLGVIAYAVHRARRRTLRILRHETERRLVVDREGVDLAFPLRLRGEQRTQHVRGVPMYHVYLQLVDGDGRAVLLHEVRGAIHGEARDWLNDGVDPSKGPELDVGGAKALADLRQRIEKINDAIKDGR